MHNSLLHFLLVSLYIYKQLTVLTADHETLHMHLSLYGTEKISIIPGEKSNFPGLQDQTTTRTNAENTCIGW